MNHFDQPDTSLSRERRAHHDALSPLTPRIECLGDADSLALYLGDSEKVLHKIRALPGSERDRLIIRLESEIGGTILKLSRTGERFVLYEKPEKATSYFENSGRLSRFLGALRRLYQQEDLRERDRDLEADAFSYRAPRH